MNSSLIQSATSAKRMTVAHADEEVDGAVRVLPFAGNAGDVAPLDPPSLRAVGGAPNSCPALGGGLGYGLRLRARGSCGAVASRVRQGIFWVANCTLDGAPPAQSPFPAAVVP